MIEQLLQPDTRRIPPVSASHLPILAGCFRGPAIRSLAAGKVIPYVSAALTDAGILRHLGPDAALKDALGVVFELLRRDYRCDYVYRSAIATKRFLGQHSPATTSLIRELRVESSKADVVMLNGTSTAFEIKSARDNTSRLESQIASYLRAFGQIVVVTDEDHEAAVRRLLPERVGLHLLTRQFTLRVARPAQDNRDHVDPGAIFDMMREAEWREATRIVSGSVPEARPVELFAACRERFTKALPRQAHDVMVRLLKQRQKLSKESFDGMPEFLIAAVLESSLPEKDWPRLLSAITVMRCHQP